MDSGSSGTIPIGRKLSGLDKNRRTSSIVFSDDATEDINVKKKKRKDYLKNLKHKKTEHMDVGNDLNKGVIKTHQESLIRCDSSSVISNFELE